MKQNRTKIRQASIFSALVALLLLSSSLQSWAQDISKSYSNKGSIAATDEVMFAIRHTDDVLIKTSNEPNVSYTVKISLKLEDEDESDKANELLNAIKIEPDKSGNTYAVKFYPFESYSSNNSGFRSKTTIKLRDGEKYTFSGQVEMDIHIEATIPKVNNFRLKASFSTVTLGHLSKKGEFKLSHSTLKANDLGKLVMDARFSKASLGNIGGSSEMNLSQSKVRTLDMGKLSAKISFSTLEGARCGAIKLPSISQSTLRVDQLGKLNITSARFSTIDINQVGLVDIKKDGQSKYRLDVVGDLRFGRASFTNIVTKQCQNVTFDQMSQSNFEAEIAKDITIAYASFSTVEVEKADNIIVTTDKQGKYYTEGVDIFRLNSGSFTKIDIGELTTEFEVYAKQTDVKIGTLSSDVSLCKLKNTFGSVSLGTDELANFDLYLKDSKFTTVNKARGIEKKSDGYYRKQTNSNKPLEIEVSCSNCTLNLR